MLSPLLIQLFGRDVVDRLENAGLASDAAVARLGADELSTKAGIAPGLAERVIALAVEQCAAKPTAPTRRRAAAPRTGRAPSRRKRRPADPPIRHEPTVPAERAASSSGKTDPQAGDEDLEILALRELDDGQETDAFVDEAGLIAWMGFAARTGADSSLLSGIAEGILDPIVSHDQDPPGPEIPTASREAATGKPVSAEPERSVPVTIEGTFWEFGTRPHRGTIISADRAGESARENDDDEATGSRSGPIRPVPFHRRRSHDGH